MYIRKVLTIQKMVILNIKHPPSAREPGELFKQRRKVVERSQSPWDDQPEFLVNKLMQNPYPG